YYLFSFAGAKIVAIFSLIIGILFITNLSLGNMYNRMKQTVQKWYEVLQSKWEKSKTYRQNKETKADAKTSDVTKTEIEDIEEIEETYEMDVGDDNEYVLPDIDLLDETVKHSQHREKSAIQKTVKVLEETFQSFGVNAKITKAHVGPAVTKYEVQPEAGVK